MSVKQKIINGIIEVEGGYVNDKNDSGGETNFGITVAVARKFGYLGAMVDITRETAFDIYAEKYWDALNLDEIEKRSEKIAEELADTCVNMGVGRAGRFFQSALNAFNNEGSKYNDLVVDGMVGRGSIAAFNAFLDWRGDDGETVLFRALNSLQGSFYLDLAARRQKDERFVYGWFLNRVK